MPVKVIRYPAARAAEKVPQSAILSQADAWGVVTRWRVTWLPEVVSGVALGHENVGQVPIVWDGACPLSSRRSEVTGAAVLVNYPVRVTFERQAIVQASRVGTLEELQPGTYHVEEIEA